MEPISELRFNALAGYIRRPEAILVSEELEWYSQANERVIAVIIRDRADGDFSAVILGRDSRQRFRCIDLLAFDDSLQNVRTALEPSMRDWAARPDADFEQGDERGQPLDFFAPAVPRERFHPSFAAVRQGEGYSPARELIAAMMYYYEDPDGNFVEQFQTTGFDARVWELYLFAALTEVGYAFDRSRAAPDLLCSGMLGSFFIEAVTVNPTTVNGLSVETGPPEDEADRRRYLADYMPIKYGSALYSKLQRRYWELPHVRDKPITFAVQDFHFPHSMSWSEPSLASYIYGRSFTALYDEAGHLNLGFQPIQEHRWGNKVIPSGFFNQPDAEHVSAVVTNAQGTITKFNRIGYKAGFGSRRVRMIRRGTRYVHDPNAARSQLFVDAVHEDAYSEDWVEGMNVYHNPNALIVLPPVMIPGAAHHFLQEDGLIRSLIPEFHPYGSETVILAPS